MFSPSFLLCVLLIFLSLTLITSSETNITLLGDAYFNNGAVSLTQELTYSSSNSNGVGRAMYTYPIRFLDPKTSSTASFSSQFSFSITPSNPSSSFGDGIAFLITSHSRVFGTTNGYIGLPPNNMSFVAVEFDTSLDPYLGDINDNHIGLDIDSVVSVASTDVGSFGIDLKSGKVMAVWIEYIDVKKLMKVWVGYSPIKPISPVLATGIDLSSHFMEFMYVGFSASNGRGNAHHVVDKWKFKTFGFLPSVMVNSVTGQDGECLMCSPDDLDIEIHPFDIHQTGKNKFVEVCLGLGGGLAVFLSVVLIVGGAVWWIVRKRRRVMSDTGQIRRIEMKKVPTRLSLAEIKSATRGFHRSKIIGEGASGIVYGGHLASGREVAVKRFSRLNHIDPFGDPFTNELAAMVGCLKHKNLVQLQGWCCEGNELVLVYDYMPQGSLDRIIHKSPNSPTLLTWERRLKIVLGVACALTYLHEECERQIIHRDVKACNIMIDSEFNAKLGDFGLAELYERNSRSHEAITPAGTMGYLAPEYVHMGVPTEKTDVYSFGVVLLEVATGKLTIDRSGVVLVDWVWDMWADGKLMEVVDNRLEGRFDKMGMERMLMVGLSCVHPNSRERPKVNDAGRVLKGEAPLPVLPARKPEVRLVSHLPEGAEEILRRDSNGVSNGTPWSTPRTHFN